MRLIARKYYLDDKCYGRPLFGGGKMFDVPEFFAYIGEWMFFAGMAMWGGTINYLFENKKENKKFKFVEYLIEVSTAAFVGVVVAIVCVDYFDMGIKLTAAASGVAGHMGARTLVLLEGAFIHKLKLLGVVKK